MNLDVEEKMERHYIRGKVYIIMGFMSVIFLLIFTILFSNFFSPLTMLIIRLAIIFTGILYNIGVSIYFLQKGKRMEKLAEEKTSGKIVIKFNGKEVRS